MTFSFAALALGLGIDSGAPARRVIRTAGIAGLVAILVDRFV